LIRRTLAIGVGLARTNRPVLAHTQARYISCKEQADLDSKHLESLLRQADQTNSTQERYQLLVKAVELCERMELEIGHQARLYDMAANAAYQIEHNERAEQYFMLAINRWVRSGVEPNSPMIIEISLKLSNIFKQNKQMDKAYSGYKWCVDTSQKYMKDHPEENESNLLALYGISLDGMGRFLYDAGKYTEALPIIQESIKVAEKIDQEGAQIANLKINFSSVLAEAGYGDHALEVLNEIIEKYDGETQISALINKALLYQLKLTEPSKAAETMKEAVKAALEAQDPQLLLMVKQLARDHNISLL